MTTHSSSRVGVLTFFVIVAAGVTALDLWSKYAAFNLSRTVEDGNYIVIPGWLMIWEKYNNGGMWSIGHAGGATTNFCFGVMSIVAALGIAVWAFRSLGKRDWFFAGTLGAILGGAVGNGYDRFAYEGVRDWIQVVLPGGYYYPTFNIADSFLVCGVIALMIASFFGHWPGEKTDSAQDATQPDPS